MGFALAIGLLSPAVFISNAHAQATRSRAGPDLGLANTGGLGFLVLSSPHALPAGDFAVSGELGLALRASQFGPGPVGVSIGLPPFLEFALSLRERGLSRDRARQGGIWRMSLKSELLDEADWWANVGAEIYGDHLARRAVIGGRVLASKRFTDEIEVGLAAGYHSGRAGNGAGPEAGAAVSYNLGTPLSWLKELRILGDVEFAGLPWSLLAGVGARWQVLPLLTMTVAVRWGIMGPSGLRATVGFTIRSRRIESQRPASVSQDVQAKREIEFRTPRPRFLMRIPRTTLPWDRTYRPLQPETSPDAGADDLERRLDLNPEPEEAPTRSERSDGADDAGAEADPEGDGTNDEARESGSETGSTEPPADAGEP